MLRSPLSELSLAIVPGRQMAVLHKKFLHRTGATDVLTFELDRDRRGRVVGAEIVICSSIAKKRRVNAAAKRSGKSALGHELLLYAIHGLLHLSGFDDRTETGFAAMHAKEDEILTRLGIGPVFAPRTGTFRLGNGVRKCRSS
jgi:probable rRNA maturation factor